MKKLFSIVPYIIISLVVGVSVVYAGTLAPSSPVSKTMYTLNDIYNLSRGEIVPLGSGAISANPGQISSTGKSLTEVYTAINTEIGKLSPGVLVAGTSSFGITGTASIGSGIIALGNALASNVLTGTTFSNITNSNINGTMVDNSSKADFSPTLTDVLIPSGYYDGVTKITGDSDLVSNNIKSGTNIFGVIGNLVSGYLYGDNDASKVLTTALSTGSYNASNLSVGTVKKGTLFGNSLTGAYPSSPYPLPGDTGVSDAIASSIANGFESWTKTGSLITGTGIIALGNALASNVLTGTTFSNATTSNITGTMLSKVGSATTITPTTVDQTIAQGYYGGVLGDGKILGSANLISGNIKSGISIFGIAGTLSGIDTSDADAVPANILLGKTSYVNALKIIGAMANNTSHPDFNPTISDISIPVGYYDGVTKIIGDSDLIANNIRSGINIFGVSGKSSVVDTSDADAIPANILLGKTSYVNGSKITGISNLAFGDAQASNVLTGKYFSTATLSNTQGAMADNSSHPDFNPTISDLSIPIGYYDGVTKIIGDSDLITNNIRSGINIFGVAGNISTGVTKTGQTSCWDASGTSISCASSGQDGQYQKGSPLSGPRFTTSGNTTFDNATELMWEKTGTATASDWTTALAYCEADSTDGYTDWRLPNIKELQSIVDFGRVSPAIDTSFFLDTRGSGYWSSTSTKSYEGYAWRVVFGNGLIETIAKNTTNGYVRCVR